MLTINAREEELKNYIGEEYFSAYDSNRIIGNIDFCVCEKSDVPQLDFTEHSYLWAEAKRGTKADIYASFVQLILTIGKAKTYTEHLPPLFLGAFDAEKIAFIRYDAVYEVFSMNDFDWTITPSDHENKHFLFLYNKIKQTLEKETFIFYYRDNSELKKFIKTNFKTNNLTTQKIQVNKNNFIFVYQKWLKEVKPTIGINWDEAKKKNILDADFYLADLISDNHKSILDNLRVVLETDKYRLRYDKDDLGDLFREYFFNDNQKAYQQFWNRYERPPKKEYWDFIIERRDLIVPQDVRERKGAFFTPQIWVEKSQEYIAQVLGENWQEEYYVWDCCAGTGNLLNGLTNKYKIFASTLDQSDVDIMKERIKNGANLLESHVFQFDFLNDELPIVNDFGNVGGSPAKNKNKNTETPHCDVSTTNSKLPPTLYDIITNPEKRKKLIIYINPPYAEAGSGQGKHKTNVSINNNTYKKYKNTIGKASNELFAQFLIRINHEISGAWLANFSTLKILQAGSFNDFRKIFQATLMKAFAVPANTFDNVNGDFPIGFFVWNAAKFPLLRGTEGVLKQKKIIDNNFFASITPEFLRSNNINSEGMIFSSNFLPYNPKLKQFSRELRKDGELAEVLLWEQLKEKKLGYTFSRQKPILNYIADFYCKELNLVIEIDGAAHFSEEAQIKDSERDNQMNVLGLTIVRVSDNDVRNNAEHVAKCILEQYIEPKLPLNPPLEGDLKRFILSGTDEVSKNDYFPFDIYDFNGNFLQIKKIHTYKSDERSINKWIKKTENEIGFLVGDAPDYQHNKAICIQSFKNDSHYVFIGISAKNLIESCIYLSVRHCIPADWLNDRDQFLYPNESWQADKEFQTNCLVYTLFHGQNRISSSGSAGGSPANNSSALATKIGNLSAKKADEPSALRPINHWIPFTEEEVNAQEEFASHFMHEFLSGKIKAEKPQIMDLFSESVGNAGEPPAENTEDSSAFQFTQSAQNVMDCGRNLWRYYHQKAWENRNMRPYNVNASLYDIKEYFQGRNEKGKMNSTSKDEEYTKLLEKLKKSLKILAEEIKPKVYEYGFLK